MPPLASVQSLVSTVPSVVLTSVQAVPVVAHRHQTQTEDRQAARRSPMPRPRKPSSFSRSVQTVARASSTRPTTHSTKAMGTSSDEQLGGEETTDRADRARRTDVARAAATVGSRRTGGLADQLTGTAEPVEHVADGDLGRRPGRRAVWRCSVMSASSSRAWSTGSRARLPTQPREVVAHQRVVGCGHHVVSLVVGSVAGRGCEGSTRRPLLNSVQADPEVVERALAEPGQGVVATRRARRRVAPDGGHQLVLAEPAEQRVDRALARHQTGGGELLDEVVAVALVVLEESQHAVLDRAAPQLGDRRLRSHASQGSAR